MKELKLSRTGLSLSHYMTFKSSSDLQISIDNLSKVLVKLLHHSSQYWKFQLTSYIWLQVSWIIVEVLLVAVLMLTDLDQTKNHLSPENSVFQITTKLQKNLNFKLSALGRLLTYYNKLLQKHQSSNTLIRNIISRLKPIYQAIP